MLKVRSDFNSFLTFFLKKDGSVILLARFYINNGKYEYANL